MTSPSPFPLGGKILRIAGIVAVPYYIFTLAMLVKRIGFIFDAEGGNGSSLFSYYLSGMALWVKISIVIVCLTGLVGGYQLIRQKLSAAYFLFMISLGVLTGPMIDLVFRGGLDGMNTIQAALTLCMILIAFGLFMLTHKARMKNWLG